MRILLPWVVVVGCGHAPPPAPKPVEKPVAAAGDIAGHWVTSDDMDWGYALTIDASGTYDMWIDRARMGRCEQKGKLSATGASAFRLSLERDECGRNDVTPGAHDLTITSFTGDALTIAMDGVTRSYRRGPSDAAGNTPRSSVEIRPGS